MNDDWLPVEGEVTVLVRADMHDTLVPVTLRDVLIHRGGKVVRGQEVQGGQFALLPVEWLVEGDRERVREVLRSSRAAGEEAEK